MTCDYFSSHHSFSFLISSSWKTNESTISTEIDDGRRIRKRIYLLLCEVIFDIERFTNLFRSSSFDHIGNCFTGGIAQSFDVEVVRSLGENNETFRWGIDWMRRTRSNSKSVPWSTLRKSWSHVDKFWEFSSWSSKSSTLARSSLWWSAHWITWSKRNLISLINLFKRMSEDYFFQYQGSDVGNGNRCVWIWSDIYVKKRE